jgi:hypothetical protein
VAAEQVRTGLAQTGALPAEADQLVAHAAAQLGGPKIT